LIKFPETPNYKIEVRYSKEVERDVYFIVNKNTGVGEVPFSVFSDCYEILDSLEKGIVKRDSKGVQDTPKVVRLN